MLAGVGAPFANPVTTVGLGVDDGFALLAVGLGVDVGVGVWEDVACPGVLAAGVAAAAFGARVVVAAAAGLAFGVGVFFTGAGAAALVSFADVAAEVDLDAWDFGAGFTAFAAVEDFSDELGAVAFVATCLGFAAAARVDFAFFSTASLTVSLATLTCSLVAWAFFGRVVETCRMLWYSGVPVRTGATPMVIHPLLHLDKSCALGPNLSILSMLSAKPFCARRGLSRCV